jgi:hypothetical protein
MRASSANLQYNYYSSDSGVLDSTPSFEASVELDTRTQLELSYSLDAVSAASFNYGRSKTHQSYSAGSCATCHPATDALSGATKNFAEVRHALGFGVKRKASAGAWGLSGKLSRENDYDSDGAKLSFEAQPGLRNSTLSLSAEAMRDTVRAQTRPGLSEELWTQAVDLSLTQILSPSSIAVLGWSYANFQGYQQNPYAFVQAGPTALPLRSRQPSRRGRQDLHAALKQGLWDGAAVQTDYRYYNDDWGVVAHTVELTLSQRLGWLVLEPTLRRYIQSEGAWFFRNFYSGSEEYLSRDLKLAPHSTRLYGLTLRGRFSEHLGGLLSYARLNREDSLDYSLYYSSRAESADILQLILTYE